LDCLTVMKMAERSILTENASIQTTENEGNYNLSVCSLFNKERLVTDRHI